MKIIFKLAIIALLLISSSAFANQMEIFLYGEKPGLSSGHPLVKDELIRIHIPRDGFSSFIVRFPETSNTLKPLEEMELKDSNFLGGPTKVEAYAVAVQNIDKSSFTNEPPKITEIPDILVPNRLLLLESFHIPKGHNPTSPMYFFEIHSPDSAFPGTYKTILHFRRAGEDSAVDIPLEIKIYKTKLPKSFALKTSFGFAPWQSMLKHFGKWVDKEIEVNEAYFSIAQENRIDLHKIYLKEPVNAEIKAAQGDPLLVGGKVGFLAQWEKLQSGELNRYKFQSSTSDLPIPDVERKEPSSYFWKSMQSSVLEHNLENQSFVYFVDEPQAADYSWLRKSVKKVKEFAPKLWLLVTTHYKKELDNTFNIWCPNMSEWDRPGFPKPSFYAERKKIFREKLWLYTSCSAHGCGPGVDSGIPDLVSDRASAYARAFPWIAYFYHAEGILYYSTVEAYRSTSEAPWKDPFIFHGNGEGTLFYPCTQELCGIPGIHVLPSLRLKVLRDGLEDMEIMHQAELQGLPVQMFMGEIIHGTNKFPHDTASFEKVRVKVLQALDK